MNSYIFVLLLTQLSIIFQVMGVEICCTIIALSRFLSPDLSFLFICTQEREREKERKRDWEWAPLIIISHATLVWSSHQSRDIRRTSWKHTEVFVSTFVSKLSESSNRTNTCWLIAWSSIDVIAFKSIWVSLPRCLASLHNWHTRA
jgi:hypothetical protein